VIEHLVDEEISIGDYVLTNGAIAAVVLVDAVVRLLQEFSGRQSAADDSSVAVCSRDRNTRGPSEFRGWKVPDILLSGNHGEIANGERNRAAIAPRKTGRIS